MNEGNGRTKAGQIRGIARDLLSDGRLHRRREISKAVREAGLNPNPLTNVLEGHFERHENADGVFYRDPGANPDPNPDEVPVYRIGELIGTNGDSEAADG